MKEIKKPLISISIPVLNEEGNLNILYNRLCAVAERMQDRCNMEFVFSDNHSTDKTWAILTELSQKDSRIKVIRFSKNFGFQRSIMANYMHTTGDAVMQIDADLQDPPELLEVFFNYWQRGYKVVYGIRKKRPENFFLSLFRKFGYWFIDKISEHPIPRDAGDFRLIDRKIIQTLSQIKTTNPYLRGMIALIGFNQIGIPYDREKRIVGKSKFNVSRLFFLGITAVFNHSALPLRIASFLGVNVLIISILGALYYVILKLFNPELQQGLASIHILVLFGIGLNSFFLGIIGEYLIRIYLVLRADPLVIIEQSLNIEHDNLKF